MVDLEWLYRPHFFSQLIFSVESATYGTSKEALQDNIVCTGWFTIFNCSVSVTFVFKMLPCIVVVEYDNFSFCQNRPFTMNPNLIK